MPVWLTVTYKHARIQRGGQGSSPAEKSQKGYLNNTSLDPLKNHKAAKPAFNFGPSSARQRNAFNGVSLVRISGIGFFLLFSHHEQKKNNNKKVVISVAGPPLTKLSGSAHDKSSLVDRNYKYRQLFPTEEVSFHTSTQIFLYKAYMYLKLIDPDKEILYA